MIMLSLIVPCLLEYTDLVIVGIVRFSSPCQLDFNIYTTHTLLGVMQDALFNRRIGLTWTSERLSS